MNIWQNKAMLDLHFPAFGAFCHRISRAHLSNRAILARESRVKGNGAPRQRHGWMFVKASQNVRVRRVALPLRPHLRPTPSPL